MPEQGTGELARLICPSGVPSRRPWGNILHLAAPREPISGPKPYWPFSLARDSLWTRYVLQHGTVCKASVAVAAEAADASILDLILPSELCPVKHLSSWLGVMLAGRKSAFFAEAIVHSLNATGLPAVTVHADSAACSPGAPGPRAWSALEAGCPWNHASLQPGLRSRTLITRFPPWSMRSPFGTCSTSVCLSVLR